MIAPRLLVLLATLLLLVSPRSALAQEELEVVVADDEAALTEIVAPAGGRTTVCEGATCPAGITRVIARNIHFGTSGARATASADLDVSATVPLLGPTEVHAHVTCDGEPRIDERGELRVHDVHCTVGNLPGIGPAVGSAVASSLEERSIDVGQQVRDGALSRHSTDPRLAAPCAATCVTHVALVSPLERAHHIRVALRVRVRPRAQCCPAH